MQISQEDPQILRDFLNYHETIKGQSEKTIQEYHLDLRMFLRFIKLMKHEMPYDTPLESIEIHDIGLELIRTITVTDVYEFLAYLAHDRVKFPNTAFATAGIGAAARARKLSSIKSFYNCMIALGIMDRNPAKDVVAAKVERKLPQILTGKEVELFLEQPDCSDLKGFRDRAMLELLYATGIRVSELIALDVDDLNLPAGVLHCESKGRERIIPLYHTAIRALSDYITQVRPQLVESPEETALFVNMSGERMSRQGF